MWSWRSLLSRTQPLLQSRLRPGRRHVSQLTAILGNSNLIGSRGYAANPDGDSRAHDQANGQDATGKRHLYVVLDDHKDGFGIHKLDLGDHDGHPDDGALRLPETPVLRVTHTTLGERVQFAAVGSSIVAIGNRTPISPVLDDRWLPGDIGGVLVYDTKTAAITVAAHLPDNLTYGNGYKAAMAVGDRLYMLDSVGKREGSGNLHCLTSDPCSGGPHGSEFWRWRRLSRSSPWCWSDWRDYEYEYESLPATPFLTKHITAYASHERYEILVSMRLTETSVTGAIFTFSRITNRWTQRRNWHLPIVGQAHYDGHLGAWVGLHAVSVGEDMYAHLVTDGHLCVGKVMSAPKEWKVGKEKLFRFDEDAAAGWNHVQAKLVPMVSGKGCTKYCLMEHLRPKENDEESEGDKWLLRLTSFHVERGDDGEPVAMAHRPACTYKVSRYNKDFEAQVFWM